ncbi:MAG: UDP-N-acetylmuramate--L-alanine ligase [Ferruginibacter sp.]
MHLAPSPSERAGGEVKGIEAVYFIGIGGIGMSAIARYYNEKGIKVSGYDKTCSAFTQQLEKEGMNIHYTDDVSLLDKTASIVVYTPAIPAEHAELNFYRDNGYALMKRSDALALITTDGFNICIAGTHGKTTTSAMVAHILRHSGYGCNAFLGGISTNYETNFWSSDNNVNVVEADEYDRSFLKLDPSIAVITAMDADHLDIYGTEKNMQDAFIDFSGRVKHNGLLIHKYGLQRAKDLRTTRQLSYALENNKADAHAKNIKIEKGQYFFDVQVKNKTLEGIRLSMGGLHNIENAIAAIVIAIDLNIEDKKIIAAVASFKGVKRRFEYIINREGLVMIDDYAHHPQELEALISGAKNLYPDKICTVVFQPHLFSRTKDLADGFAKALSMADETILLPIYPARELPIEGVTSQLIYDKLTIAKKKMLAGIELLDYLKREPKELLIMCGAGDIDMMIEPVKNIFEKK